MNTLKDRRFGRFVGHDLLANHEPFQIGDEVHAPFDVPIRSVTTIAVGLENVLSLLRQRVRLHGNCRDREQGD